MTPSGDPHNTQPAVSVIIPCYKAAQHIAQTLDSLRRQTFRNFEILLVNDASPDSAEFEAALIPYQGEFVYLKQERNQGPSAARNRGILAAKAPLIAMLDSDDTWEPDYLEFQTAFLAAHPEIDIVYPNAVFTGESDWTGRVFMDMIPSRGPATFRSILMRECNVFTGVLAKRAVFDLAVYDPALLRAEDFDLWLRLAKAGARFAYHDRILVRYRISNNSLSDDKIQMQSATLAVYQKLAARTDLTPEERQLVSEAISTQVASLDFFRGKLALYRHDRATAVRYLISANQSMRDFRLTLTILMLRICPWLLYRYIHKTYPSEYAFLH